MAKCEKNCINDGERQLRFTVTGGGENSLAGYHFKCYLPFVPIDYKKVYWRVNS